MKNIKFIKLILLILITAHCFSNGYEDTFAQAEILFQNKNYQKSLFKAFKTLEIAKENYGDKSKQVADTLYFISLIYFYSNKKEKAKDTYLRYLKLTKK